MSRQAASTTERRIYLLDAALLASVRAYQETRNFASEAEAVRDLLQRGLMSSETPEMLMRRLSARPMPADGYRAVARDLVEHPLVKSIAYMPGYILIGMTDGSEHRFPQEARK
ncbi:hypothetical protein [Falsiroseomonas tokyonensis]|uniref:Uncharacterized protein n=1 Tax=Falsiroseomonas tokyonensis TaxID=430521 RepID=A0ABV7BXG1_9PROT|nr:hypothetical protein [Falsiroseomonas tokyonensis]MBU8540208.1 hypothetical protein [Falsiroseomonas tokyonensis]